MNKILLSNILWSKQIYIGGEEKEEEDNQEDKSKEDKGGRGGKKKNPIKQQSWEKGRRNCHKTGKKKIKEEEDKMR